MCIQYYKNLKKIKLVIIDTYSSNAYYFALFLAVLSKIHKKSYILVLSGGDLENRLHKSKSFTFILKNSKYIISPSKYLYDIFNKYNHNTEYIPNYLDLDLYAYKKRTSIDPKILWVRSIHKIYNPTMPVLVIKEIIKKYPKVKLCMIGPQKDDSIIEVKKIIKENKLEENIILTGKLEKKEWIKLSEEYDVFINTTNYDNHPVTLLESMALGLPIVSTNVGGIPNLLTHNFTAKLVKPNDISSMASNILQYLSDDEKRINIASNARNMIENNFNRDTIINKWYQLIDNIIQ
tara:strand:- start:26 stop:901 length:876 start_codon:yes stop_codon:yes gene_type:complete